MPQWKTTWERKGLYGSQYQDIIHCLPTSLTGTQTGHVLKRAGTQVGGMKEHFSQAQSLAQTLLAF